MKNKNGIISNLFYSIAANAFSLFVSALIVFIVPKYISKADYGYWQLYLFYTAYIGFFHFGWVDGIYLRYGGEYYEKLNHRTLGQQFWGLTFFEALISILMVVVVLFLPSEESKKIVLYYTIANLVLVIPKTYLSYVLQATNRIKEYSFITIWEKAVYCIIVVAILLIGKRAFLWLVLADIAGKCISLIYGIFVCKSLVFPKNCLTDLRASWIDAKENVKAGINLLIANLSGMLILGIMRMSIEQTWSVEVFGEVSLAISVSNMLLVFINAIGTVLFPMLKRMQQDKLADTYMQLRNVMMLILLAALLVYFPAQLFLAHWLPQYKVGISYMAVLFPVCIFESKMALLSGPYLKAMRMEKHLLYVNCIAVALSILLSGLSVFLLKNLELAMVCVLILFAVRSILCELLLQKKLSINLRADILVDSAITAVFCVVSWFIPYIGWLIYLGVYGLYLYFKKSQIRVLLQFLKKGK